MAIKIVRPLDVDVVKRGAARAVYAKQYDYNSRFLNVRIQEDGKDITIGSGAQVVLNVERPDKQENMFYGTVNEDGTVQVPLTSWMLELSGTLLCDISIVQEDVAKLTTMQFNIYVEEAVITDASFVETEEYSVVVDLLKRTDEAAEKATKTAEEVEVLKEDCEDAINRANNASEEAEALVSGYIKRVEEQNHLEEMTFWIGTLAEYDAIPEKRHNCLYIISDDPTRNTLTMLTEFMSKQQHHNEVLWEGSAESSDDISFDASRHSAFIVEAVWEDWRFNIVCHKLCITVEAGPAVSISGFLQDVNSSMFVEVLISQTDGYNQVPQTFNVEQARYSTDTTFGETVFDIQIVKITGIM